MSRIAITPTASARVVLLLAVAVIALYFRVLGIWAYGDDFLNLAAAADPRSRWDIFGQSSYVVSHAFRPLERIVNAANVALLGHQSTLFTHAVALLGMLLSALALHRLALALDPGRTKLAWFASLFLLVHPASVLSVLQIDTISQVYATVVTLLIVHWLMREPARGWSRHAIFGVLVLAAVLTKETTLGVIAAAPIAAWLLAPKRASGRPGFGDWFRHRAMPAYTVMAIVAVVYVVLRALSANGIGSHGSRVYAITLAPDVVARNVAQMVGGVVYAGSSLEVFPAPRPAWIAISLALTLLLAVLCARGLWSVWRRASSFDVATRSEAHRTLRHVAGFALLIVGAMFPVVLLGKVSELYLFQALPFVAALAALLVSRALDQTDAQQRQLGIPGFSPLAMRMALALLLVWLAYGNVDKQRRALEISQRAQRYYGQVSAWLAQHPTRSALCWPDVTTSVRMPAYSEFAYQDHILLRGVATFTARMAGRSLIYRENGQFTDCEFEVRGAGDDLRIIPATAAGASRGLPSRALRAALLFDRSVEVR